MTSVTAQNDVGLRPCVHCILPFPYVQFLFGSNHAKSIWFNGFESVVCLLRTTLTFTHRETAHSGYVHIYFIRILIHPVFLFFFRTEKSACSGHAAWLGCEFFLSLEWTPVSWQPLPHAVCFILLRYLLPKSSCRLFQIGRIKYYSKIRQKARAESFLDTRFHSADRKIRLWLLPSLSAFCSYPGPHLWPALGDVDTMACDNHWTESRWSRDTRVVCLASGLSLALFLYAVTKDATCL